MKPHFYAILAAFFAGTVGILVKLSGTDIHPMTLVFYRVFLAFLFLLIFVPLIDKNTFKINKSDLKTFFFVGVLIAIAIALFTIANTLAPVQNVFLLVSTAPFFVLIIAYFWLKEKITSTKIITLIIAIIGLIIINPFQSGFALGNLLAIITALFYALFITAMRNTDKDHSIGSVVWFFFFSTLILLPFPFIYGFGSFSLESLKYILLLGFIATALQFLFYNMALKKVEAETDSLINTIVSPIVAIILAVLIISEPLNLRTIIGGSILVFSGIYLETHKKKLKQDR
ncbi:hypothetical protein CL617_04740 [archaeon]|nr:hypothetical protein [archaeon]|tara:strand:- start:3734 stop:4591 length:858 start_codon:yes stop_codon:yes gene_type:complete